jgi:hypothetical protein
MKIPSAHSHKLPIRLRAGKILSSHMEKIPLALALLVAAVAFSPLGARAQSTYTTLNGTVNLIAGLANLSSATAINTTNQATGISYITDSSWSTTGIENLGMSSSGEPILNGTLAGTFGGGTYFAASNSIILTGVYPGEAGVAWGGWRVRLLLSDDNYSPAISFTNSDLAPNPAVTINASWYSNELGTAVNFGTLPTLYQELNIAAFDTGNIGVKGIELSNFATPFPDISYIGVTGVVPGPGPSPVPEPGQVAASLLLLAGIGGYVWMKRRKTAKPATAAA